MDPINFEAIRILLNVKDNNDCHVYDNVILSKNVIRQFQSDRTAATTGFDLAEGFHQVALF